MRRQGLAQAVGIEQMRWASRNRPFHKADIAHHFDLCWRRTAAERDHDRDQGCGCDHDRSIWSRLASVCQYGFAENGKSVLPLGKRQFCCAKQPECLHSLSALPTIAAMGQVPHARSEFALGGGAGYITG